MRYPYAKESRGATRREGRFSARMIYAVIVQRLTCGRVIARVPEEVPSLGTSPHQGRFAIGRVPDEGPAAMGEVCIDAVPPAYRDDF